MIAGTNEGRELKFLCIPNRSLHDVDCNLESADVVCRAIRVKKKKKLTYTGIFLTRQVCRTDLLRAGLPMKRATKKIRFTNMRLAMFHSHERESLRNLPSAFQFKNTRSSSSGTLGRPDRRVSQMIRR